MAIHQSSDVPSETFAWISLKLVSIALNMKSFLSLHQQTLKKRELNWMYVHLTKRKVSVRNEWAFIRNKWCWRIQQCLYANAKCGSYKIGSQACFSPAVGNSHLALSLFLLVEICMRRILFTFKIFSKRTIHNGKVISPVSLSNSLMALVSLNH